MLLPGLQIIRTSLVILCALSLAACGTKYSRSPSATERPAPVVQPANTQLPDPAPTDQTVPVIRPTATNPAVDEVRSLPAAVALREQATSASAQSNHLRAIGLLERAIRISPQDPQTFQDLAKNHLAMNQPAQALELVQRALSLNPSAKQQISLQALAEQCRAML